MYVHKHVCTCLYIESLIEKEKEQVAAEEQSAAMACVQMIYRLI